MDYRSVRLTFALAVVILLGLLVQIPGTAQAQSSAANGPWAKAPWASEGWMPPHNPDGTPDLQGIWSDISLTPLERPKDLGSREFYTDQEIAELSKRAHERDASQEGTESLRYDLSLYGFDPTKLRFTSNRTSLIVGPQGRVPPILPEAKERMAGRIAQSKGHEFDSYANRGLSERCLLINQERIPVTPGTNDGHLQQIVQGPGWVAILGEVGYHARVIPTDGRPHIPENIRELQGDSVGHWEGDTLVVDTANFTGRSLFRGSSEKLHLIERLTRVAGNTVLYEFTVEDPTTWAKPWSAEIPWTANPGPVYEFACHEGNNMLSTGLRGARVGEAEAAQKRTSELKGKD